MKIRNQQGYSMIELIIVIIIIGIIAAIVAQSMGGANDAARVEETRDALQRLAVAIAGDSDLRSGGVRADYGYVGDIGALPPGLDALVSNPGGYGTWNGPYIKDDFTLDGSDSRFKTDAWGQPYAYTGLTVQSTGGSTTITRRIANSSAELTANRVSLTITDLSHTPPGDDYRDSVRVLLTYPDGAGGVTIAPRYPGADGFLQYDSIPIGIHDLRVVYLPTADTIVRQINVDPGAGYHGDIQYFGDVWGDNPGGLNLVPGSVTAGESGNCDRVYFSIVNTTGADIDVSSLQLIWSSPNAHYSEIYWDGSLVWSSTSPRAGSGDISVFSPTQTISDGQTVAIEVHSFRTSPNGVGSAVDMNNVSLTARLSDGSIFDLATGGCP